MYVLSGVFFLSSAFDRDRVVYAKSISTEAADSHLSIYGEVLVYKHVSTGTLHLYEPSEKHLAQSEEDLVFQGYLSFQEVEEHLAQICAEMGHHRLCQPITDGDQANALIDLLGRFKDVVFGSGDDDDDGGSSSGGDLEHVDSLREDAREARRYGGVSSPVTGTPAERMHQSHLDSIQSAGSVGGGGGGSFLDQKAHCSGEVDYGCGGFGGAFR